VGELCRRPAGETARHSRADGGGASRAEARSGRPFIEGMALRQLELVVAPPVEPEAAVVRAWHRGLCIVASSVAGAPSDWSYGSPDAAGLREAAQK
jgi:hypothetical protein